MPSPILLRASLVALCLALVHDSTRAAAPEIVLYASDVDAVAGMWSKAASPGSPGNLMLTTPDGGWASASVPIAAPEHYFEATFDAQAATTYQIWLRMRGAANSKWNESVWVQFNQSTDTAGAPVWRIGSSSALLINLENCGGCGLADWGWQDNAYWLAQPGRVRFDTSGPQTIRVQVREDGVSIDQIVLSPATYTASAPGPLKNDTTIVPKPSANPGVVLVRHPYLQQVGPTSAVVVWATRENGIADVRYTRAGTTKIAAASTRLVPAATTGMGFDYYQHEATLAGLAASSTYAYTATVDGIDVSTSAPLVTAPPVGQGTARFLAFGDSGVGSSQQRQLSALMSGEAFDFAVHTGDVAYGAATGSGAGSYPQLHQWFFDIYRDWLRTHPMYPSIGNHDEEANRAAPFRDVFVLPGHGATTAFPDHAERYYSFDYGPVHVVVLDTELAFQNTTRRQAQLDWLEADLAATRQPWKMAVFHRSPYSAGGEHGSDLSVRAALAPIFDRHHVDLVLSGHEHDYERTVPLRETTDGGPTVYVVTGGGGAPLYPAASAWWTAASASAFHYVRGRADACQLTIEAIGLSGAVFDGTVIDKCQPATPPPAPSLAWGGTPVALPGVIQVEQFDQGGPNVSYADTTPGNAGGGFRATDVDLQPTTDTGGGFNVGWIKPSEWLAYSVNVQRAATYTLTARVASLSPGGTFHVEVDGVDVTGPLVIPVTGGHQVWTSVTKGGIALQAGARTVRLVFDASGSTGSFGNINYLRIDER